MASAKSAASAPVGKRPTQEPPAEEVEELGALPERPPGLALSHGKNMEEILADLNKSPLFMTELEENDDVAALQALAYEGTPLENATNFKEQGNECFRARRWADAKEFYGRGIPLLAAEDARRARGEKQSSENDNDDDAPDEVARQHAVLEQLYVNRAACHLELGNYRSCTADCAGALRLNPGNVKAFYRSTRALLALGKIEEADDACARGLAVVEAAADEGGSGGSGSGSGSGSGGNAALRALAAEIVKRAGEADAKRERENARLARTKRQQLLLRAALKARGIRTRSTDRPPEMEDARLQLLPDPDDPTSSLSFPTVLLYPTDLESDFVKAFSETECLEQHFGYVFPLPWDRNGTYSTPAVDCFMETVPGGLVKVGKKVPLLKVLSTANVEVVDEVVKVFVVPRSKAAAWAAEYKAKRAAEKSSS